ncbi:hypothetical protein [Glutamicibacter nicotianae]|uniref:hypothetical protein n=1 Tax=Glutamicibacter nicotianae TaxID=37929 RepID=UPI003C3010C7
MMFLRDLLLSCLRRWYFLLLGLLLTGAGTYYVYTSIEPTYEANASVVLIPPKVAVMTGDNPYLYLGGLDQALGVLQVKVASPEVLDKLTGGREDAEVSIGEDATTSGPIAAIKVSAKDAAGTMQLLDAALKQVPQTLDELQKEQAVPAKSVITSMELSRDGEPTAITKRQIQFTAMAAVAGASMSLLLTGLLDRLLLALKLRRKARRAKKASVEENLTADLDVEFLVVPGPGTAQAMDEDPSSETIEERHVVGRNAHARS